MKLKSWIVRLTAAICFTFVGIMKLIVKEYFMAIMFIFLGGSYFILSMIYYNDRNKSNENTLSDIELENMDNELKNLIAEGKKIQAIKRYRIITGLGLKEAKEYVDLLSEKN